MPLVQYILRPESPFHFSSGREGDSADIEHLPRSDTLASAILSVWRHADPSASEATVEALAADPPFAISSVMPALIKGNAIEVLLFTPPRAAEAGALDDVRRKTYRKARFANIDALRSILRREELTHAALLISDDGKVLSPAPPDSMGPNSGRPLDRTSSNHLWYQNSRPRLSIDRSTGTAVEGILFRYASTVFRSDVRLVVLVEFRNPGLRAAFGMALRLLGHSGIGGGRSIGHGRFTLERISDGFNPNLGSGARLLLSLTHPSKSEINKGLLDPPALYTLLARGGWSEFDGAGATLRRSVNMLGEGSIVHELGTERYGDSVCVLNADEGLHHPVYRLGCAVALPIEWKGEQHA
jgi:CRISPR type III-A-associated RAMP protein Csm4